MKKLEQIPTATLISYSSILENIMSSNMSIMNELDKGVSTGHAKPEEARPIYEKAFNLNKGADELYAKVQEELDARMKAELGWNGIRQTRALFKELDSFVAGVNKRFEERIKGQEDAAGPIAAETKDIIKLNPDQDADTPK